MTVREIAAWLEGTVVGPDDARITGVGKIEDAGPGAVTFLSNPKYAKFLSSTKATAVLVSGSVDPAAAGRSDLAFIVVPDPYIAFLRCMKRLVPQTDPFAPGVHPTAVVGPTAVLGQQVRVGAYAVIADGAVVGAGTRVGPHVSIGPKAVVGDECVLHAGVRVYDGCILGARVVVHAGAVIGSDGFGFAPRGDGSYEKIPQMGIVRVGDDCEIGANTTIDRATLGETRIGTGVKLDNLVQVAHNVVIGDHTVIAAQTGISGSSRIGSHCKIAGQVGISGHIEIADRTTIMGQSGVSKSIEEPGKAWFGYPVKEQVRAARIEAVVRSLPELRAEVERLRDAIAATSSPNKP